MLLFIGEPWTCSDYAFEFQYISCYSLSYGRTETFTGRKVSIHLMLLFIYAFARLSNNFACVSIHLMLLFIRMQLDNGAVEEVFQYISCYSLSPIAKPFRLWVTTFQYISCYSLSFFAKIKTKIFYVSIHLMLLFIRAPWIKGLIGVLFQYISCYSLSTPVLEDASDLFVFQYISCYSLSGWLIINQIIHISFNTSHVTLYRGWIVKSW